MAGLGHAYGMAGRKDEAWEVLTGMLACAERWYVPPVQIAFVYLSVDEKEKATAQQFLHHTDLVKFAKHIPDTDEVENEHQEAVTFIHKTKEEPVNEPTD